MKEIAQHGGGLSVQQQQQQQAGQGAAAAGLGAAAVSAAAAAAAGAADAAAPKEQVKGIKAWGKQSSSANTIVKDADGNDVRACAMAGEKRGHPLK
jgi:hypothetical protein